MNAMPAAAGKRAEAGVCARARGSPLSPTQCGLSHSARRFFSLLTLTRLTRRQIGNLNQSSPLAAAQRWWARRAACCRADQFPQ
jgi:hypothetical protein